MITLFKYPITDFKKVDNPEKVKCLDTGKERVFKYSGIVKDELIFWDKYGRCRNLMFNDYFINPDCLIDFLDK